MAHTEADAFEKIRKNDFVAYERVRVGGRFNMFDPRATALSGLSEERYLAILKHYDDCCKKWPEVRRR